MREQEIHPDAYFAQTQRHVLQSKAEHERIAKRYNWIVIAAVFVCVIIAIFDFLVALGVFGIVFLPYHNKVEKAKKEHAERASFLCSYVMGGMVGPQLPSDMHKEVYVRWHRTQSLRMLGSCVISTPRF